MDRQNLQNIKNEILASFDFEINAKNFAKNLNGSFLSFFLIWLKKSFNCTVLFIASDTQKAITVKEDCEILEESTSSIFIFDSFHKSKIIDSTNQVLRNETIERLLRNEKIILSTDIISLAKAIPKKIEAEKKIITLTVGDEFGFEKFIEKLTELGFEKKNFVESVGDYSIRGGIIDVFPFNNDEPIRVEFYGDKIESIRSFDVVSQKSDNKINEIKILADTNQTDLLNKGNVFDYLPSDVIVICDEISLLKKEYNDFKNEGATFDFEFDDIILNFKNYKNIERLILSDKNNSIDFFTNSQPSCGGRINPLLEKIEGLLFENYKIFISSESKTESDRLKDLILTNESFPIERITFLDESIHNGFISHKNKIAIFTEHEIFSRIKQRGKKKKFIGLTKKNLKILKYDDFVVHADYGIGRFSGLHKIKIKGHEQEVAKIEYFGGATLFVNLNFIEKIQKYSSAEGHTPTLNHLGSADWTRLKERAKKKIKDIARDLIKLYAKRKSETGFSFDPDTTWQKELEASFEFDDTPDQTKTTNEIKKDMESASPMDRLVCGDVGFGKTEIAIRAAFKAIMNGKQVAVLVPTTILAEQHFNTFKKRLEGFSVKVEMVSRFRTAKETKKIFEELKNKQVDVLIGTHKIFSKDVSFSDLGLLIIDEEHRFGVSAKEKLRSLKVNVDTLTLTATPIPRTLQFSLLGVRDLSIINTPPKNRLPIHTEIIEWDEKIISDAIKHELHRGGQVFFVNDRIQTIDKIKKLIEKNIPEVKCEIAHGQLKGHELEKVMHDFMNKKFSILITTKIIESGIDIPSANTIIINRADRFGMAELHQLRGRVGRSNLQAFSYLLVPSISSLSRDSLNKLMAIEEYNELGSGFTLAMRDLEIRGAGNLLGGEQSGFILEMGFEMYERTLAEAVDELKEEEFLDLKTKREINYETTIEVDVDALIPDFYVEDQTERLNIYRRIMSCRTLEDLNLLQDELVDRFGKMLEETENLFLIAELKVFGSELKFRKIEIESEKIKILLPPQTENNFYDNGKFQKIMDCVNKDFYNSLKLIQQHDKLFISGNIFSPLSEKKLIEAKKFLEKLKNL